MADRTQLNVNISPELLKSLKHNAIKSGMTLASYVTEIINNYISKNHLKEEENLINTRIESIEDQLENITSQLNLINNPRKIDKVEPVSKINGFSKEGSNAFGKAISELFIDECKKKGLSTQAAVIELIPHIQSTFNIKYWGQLIEMFSENKISTTPDLMYEIYRVHGDKCPMSELFSKWCGKEPKIINQHFLQAVID